MHIGEDCLLLGQKKYITDLLLKVHLSDASSLPTPMSGNFLTKVATYQDVSHLPDANLYRSNVGVLQHVCVTRP